MDAEVSRGVRWNGGPGAASGGTGCARSGGGAAVGGELGQERRDGGLREAVTIGLGKRVVAIDIARSDSCLWTWWVSTEARGLGWSSAARSLSVVQLRQCEEWGGMAEGASRSK